MNKIEPTYLRYIYDQLEDGLINSQNDSSLPNGFVEVFEEEFLANMSVIKRTSIINNFGIWALLKEPVSIEFYSKISGLEHSDVIFFIDKYSKWFVSTNNNKFSLYHDRLKIFFLQKLGDNELKFLNNQIISFLEENIDLNFENEITIYSINNLGNHLLVESQCNNKYESLIKLALNNDFTKAQVRFSKEYIKSLDLLKKCIKESSRRSDKPNLEKLSLKYLKINDEQNLNYDDIINFIIDQNYDLAFNRIDYLNNELKFKCLIYILEEMYFGKLLYVKIDYNLINKIIEELKVLLDEKNNYKIITVKEKEEVKTSVERDVVSELMGNKLTEFITKEVEKKIKIIDWTEFYPQLNMFYLSYHLYQIDIDFSFIWDSINIEINEIINHPFNDYGFDKEQMLIFLISKLNSATNVEFDVTEDNILKVIKCSLKNNFPNSFKWAMQYYLAFLDHFQKNYQFKDYYLRILSNYKMLFKVEKKYDFNCIENLTIEEIKKSLINEHLLSYIMKLESVDEKLIWLKHIIYVSINHKDEILSNELENCVITIINENPSIKTNLDLIYQIASLFMLIGENEKAYNLIKDVNIPIKFASILNSGPDSSNLLLYAPGTNDYETAKQFKSDEMSGLVFQSVLLSKLNGNLDLKEFAEKIISNLEVFFIEKNDEKYNDIIIRVCEYFLSINLIQDAIKLIDLVDDFNKRSLITAILKKHGFEGKAINYFKIQELIDSKSNFEFTDIKNLKETISPILINRYIQDFLKSSLLINGFNLKSSLLFFSNTFKEILINDFEDLAIDIHKLCPLDYDFSRNYPLFKLVFFLLHNAKLDEAKNCIKHFSNETFKYFATLLYVKQKINKENFEENIQLVKAFSNPLLKFFCTIFIIEESKNIGFKNLSTFSKYLNEFINDSSNLSYQNILCNILYNYLDSFSSELTLKIEFPKGFKNNNSKNDFIKWKSNLDFYFPDFNDFSLEIIDYNYMDMNFNQKFMEEAQKTKIEYHELLSVKESKYKEMTEWGFQRLNELEKKIESKDFSFKKTLNELTQENIEDNEYDFLFSIFNDYPYYSLQRGERLLSYFLKSNNEKKFNRYLNEIIELIKNNQDTFLKSEDEVGDILNYLEGKMGTSLNNRKFSKYLESLLFQNPFNYYINIELYFKIHKLTSNENLLEFMLKEDIVFSESIIDFFKIFLKENYDKIKTREIIDFYKSIKFQNNNLKYEIIKYSLKLIKTISKKEISQLIDLIVDFETKKKLIPFLHLNEFHERLRVVSENCDNLEVNKKNLIGKQPLNSVIKIWDEKIINEFDEEETKKRKEIIVHKGEIINENNLSELINSEIKDIVTVTRRNKFKDFDSIFINKTAQNEALFNSSEVLNKKNSHIIVKKSINYLSNLNYSSKELKDLIKLSSSVEIDSPENFINFLVNNDSINEALNICDFYEEDYGIYKYESQKTYQKNGVRFNFNLLEKSLSPKSNSLSIISKELLKKGDYVKAIDVANKIVDVYIKINLFIELRSIVTGGDIKLDNKENVLKLLRDYQESFYDYQDFFTVKKSVLDDKSENYHIDNESLLEHYINLFFDEKKDYQQIILKKIHSLILKNNKNNVAISFQGLEFCCRVFKNNNVIKDNKKLILEIFDSSEGLFIEKILDKKSLNIERIDFLNGCFLKYEEIEVFENICKKILSFYELLEPVEIMMADEILLDALDVMSFDKNYPGMFYYNAVEIKDRLVYTSNVYFDVYKILFKNKLVESSKKFLEGAYFGVSSDIFDKKWGEICEQHSIEDPEKILSHAFREYLITYNKGISFSEKVNQHHNAIANKLIFKLLNYFSDKNMKKEFDWARSYVGSPTNNDVFSENFNVLDKHNIENEKMGILKNNLVNNCFMSFKKHLILFNSIINSSGGEVLLSETLDHTTKERIKGGLFCENIFYKKQAKKSLFSFSKKKEDNSNVYTIGHINLVSRAYNYNCNDFVVSSLIGISINEFHDILNYKKTIVKSCDEKCTNSLGFKLNVGDIISFEDYDLNITNDSFKANYGTEALVEILQSINLSSKNREVESLSKDFKNSLSVYEGFMKFNDEGFDVDNYKASIDLDIDNNSLVEMIFPKLIPVVEEIYRPILYSDEGKPIISETNDFYRKIIIRNNRMKRLIDIKAPEVILRNEKRMLNESVKDLTNHFTNIVSKINLENVLIEANNNLSVLESFNKYSEYFIEELFQLVMSISQIQDSDLKSNYLLKASKIQFKLYQKYYSENNIEVSLAILNNIVDICNIKNFQNFERKSDILQAFGDNPSAILLLASTLNEDDFSDLIIMFFKYTDISTALKLYNTYAGFVFKGLSINKFSDTIKQMKLSDYETNLMLLNFPDNTYFLNEYLKNKPVKL